MSLDASSAGLIWLLAKTQYEEIDGEPREGDQLARDTGVVLRPGDNTYYHHGIYVGEQFVIEYADSSKIRRISLIEFRDGKPLYRVMYDPTPQPLETKEVVRKAKCALATPADFGTYGMQTNNCEHFATYCKYGSRGSPQVVKAVKDTITSGVEKVFVKTVTSVIVDAVLKK